ncbi:MAG: efflux transporter outer membrane subunit [Sphingomicrobium sp.]
MKRSVASLGVALLLSGCVMGPDYVAPQPAAIGVPAQYAPPATGSEPVGPRAAAEDLSTWWRQLNDPLLSDLIARATAGNLQIAQSLARLSQAREERIRAGGDLLPTLNGSGGVGRNVSRGGGRLSSDAQLSVGGDASWQADIFGRLKRGLQAARSDETAALFDLEGVRTSVAGEVATNYINARLAQTRLEVARSTLGTQDDNLQIARWRVQAGLVSSLDVEQARAQRAQTAASIPSLETAYLRPVARLGTLTGQAPGALRSEMDAAAPIPRGPNAIGIGIPADTLRRRPDVRSAERQLEAATARIGVAQAALYPALSISGNLDTNARSVGNLGSLITGGLIAGVTQAIFDAGRRRSQVRSTRAAADIAFSNYKQTVISGLEDVEVAVQALNAAKARQVHLAIALDASNNAALYARSQYQSGLIDFLRLLQSEQALLSARDQLASAQADQALALVQLYLALGGGWQPENTHHQGLSHD